MRIAAYFNSINDWEEIEVFVGKDKEGVAESIVFTEGGDDPRNFCMIDFDEIDNLIAHLQRLKKETVGE